MSLVAWADSWAPTPCCGVTLALQVRPPRPRDQDAEPAEAPGRGADPAPGGAAGARPALCKRSRSRTGEPAPPRARLSLRRRRASLSSPVPPTPGVSDCPSRPASPSPPSAPPRQDAARCLACSPAQLPAARPRALAEGPPEAAPLPGPSQMCAPTDRMSRRSCPSRPPSRTQAPRGQQVRLSGQGRLRQGLNQSLAPSRCSVHVVEGTRAWVRGGGWVGGGWVCGRRPGAGMVRGGVVSA